MVTKLAPVLNEGETLPDWVAYMNGDLTERKGTPIPEPEEIPCYYCKSTLTENELRDYDFPEGWDYGNEQNKDYIYCRDCASTAQRHICG